MADEPLAFPRLVYRGKPDTLGQGTLPDPVTGELVGETMRAESQQHFDNDLKKDGWRLTRDDPSKPKGGATEARRPEDVGITGGPGSANLGPRAAAPQNAAGVNPHESTAAVMTAHIGTVQSVEELDQLRDQEMEHPDYENGRASVLRAIKDRRAKLSA